MDKKLVEEAVRCKLGQQYLDGYKASGEHAVYRDWETIGRAHV